MKHQPSPDASSRGSAAAPPTSSPIPERRPLSQYILTDEERDDVGWTILDSASEDANGNLAKPRLDVSVLKRIKHFLTDDETATDDDFLDDETPVSAFRNRVDYPFYDGASSDLEPVSPSTRPSSTAPLAQSSPLERSMQISRNAPVSTTSALSEMFAAPSVATTTVGVEKTRGGKTTQVDETERVADTSQVDETERVADTTQVDETERVADTSQVDETTPVVGLAQKAEDASIQQNNDKTAFGAETSVRTFFVDFSAEVAETEARRTIAETPRGAELLFEKPSSSAEKRAKKMRRTFDRLPNENLLKSSETLEVAEIAPIAKTPEVAEIAPITETLEVAEIAPSAETPEVAEIAPSAETLEAAQIADAPRRFSREGTSLRAAKRNDRSTGRRLPILQRFVRLVAKTDRAAQMVVSTENSDRAARRPETPDSAETLNAAFDGVVEFVVAPSFVGSVPFGSTFSTVATLKSTRESSVVGAENEANKNRF